MEYSAAPSPDAGGARRHSTEGALARPAPAGVAAARVVARAASALASARAAGIPVVHIAVQFRPGHPEVASRGLFAMIRQMNGFVEGTPGAAIHDAVAPAEGEVVCIIGPSGSGKSTLLRCINYLEEPEKGRIAIDGQNAYRDVVNGKVKNYPTRQIAATREKIGMVFQQFNLFPHLTALQNIMEAPRQVKQDRKSVV